MACYRFSTNWIEPFCQCATRRSSSPNQDTGGSYNVHPDAEVFSLDSSRCPHRNYGDPEQNKNEANWIKNLSQTHTTTKMVDSCNELTRANESWAKRWLVSSTSPSPISMTVWTAFPSSSPRLKPSCLAPPLIIIAFSFFMPRLPKSFEKWSSYGLQLTLLGKLPPSRCRVDTDEYFFWRELCCRREWLPIMPSLSSNWSCLSVSAKSCKDPPCVWRFDPRTERPKNRFDT